MSSVGQTAVEIAAAVRQRRVSPLEVVQDHLRQVEAFEPKVNAFLTIRGEKALAEASGLAARPDLADLPLAGVPVAIKDSVAVAGEPTRLGSLATSPAPAAADDELVRRLREAGCIVIGKTHQPELAIFHFTESNLGVTRNPWNLDHTPGGSSGGAGAALAAAMVPLAQASDGGGSIRIPAAFCGLFGIKPGPGVVPCAGGLDEHWFGLSEWGPLATTVADAALLLDVLANSDRYRDPRPPDRSLRVALSTKSPAPGTRADREVRLATEASAEALRRAGHTVVVTDPPYPPSLSLAFLHRFFAGIARDVEVTGLRVNALEPRTQAMARIGRYLNRRHPVPKTRGDAWNERFRAWFKDFDVLLTPTTAKPYAPASGWLGKGWIRTVNAGTQQVPFTQAWNVASFPAASIPAGLSADGSPLGTQVVAPRGHEELVLSVCAQLEELRPLAAPRTDGGRRARRTAVSVAEGTNAPGFTLPDQAGADWMLDQALAETQALLIFYRGDWCPYCNGQLMTYARRYEEFEGRGGRIAGISVDTPEQNAAMVEKLLLPFPLLSDPEGEVIRAYGVWDEKETIARPSTFMLDRTGEVRFQYVARDYADRPGTEALLLALEGAG